MEVFDTVSFVMKLLRYQREFIFLLLLSVSKGIIIALLLVARAFL